MNATLSRPNGYAVYQSIAIVPVNLHIVSNSDELDSRMRCQIRGPRRTFTEPPPRCVQEIGCFLRLVIEWLLQFRKQLPVGGKPFDRWRKARYPCRKTSKDISGKRSDLVISVAIRMFPERQYLRRVPEETLFSYHHAKPPVSQREPTQALVSWASPRHNVFHTRARIQRATSKRLLQFPRENLNETLSNKCVLKSRSLGEPLSHRWADRPNSFARIRSRRISSLVNSVPFQTQEWSC